tara:strand:+ start:4634 stop:5959 length:1326 start_codon:yes stop_codon:yes gene_type:complete
MNLLTLAKHLSEIDGEYVYIKCPMLDFTSKSPGKITVFTEQRDFEIELEPETVGSICRFFLTTIFQPGKMILFWGAKNLFSYHLFHTGKDFKTIDDHESTDRVGRPIYKEPVILDLKIVESYCAVHQNAPQSYEDAVRRLKAVYPKFRPHQAIYNAVHAPLFKRVIPHLETVGIIYETERRYAHYEIEGQANGRLKCANIFSKSYIPHVLKPEDRPLYRPLDMDLFVYFDYSGLEICALQWLSGDENLLDILKSKDDVYAGIVEKITGKAPAKAREFGKKLVIPVIYGAQAPTIAKSLGVSEEIAAKLINRLSTNFPDAMRFLNEATVENGLAVDHFGRRRIFDDGFHRVKNFVVQSPAATICLTKLVDLHKALISEKVGKLGFYIHDGYGIFCNKSDYIKVIKMATEALEGESRICPGIKLKTSCSVGVSLDRMKDLKRK